MRKINNVHKAREILSKFENQYHSQSVYNIFLRAFNEVIAIANPKNDKYFDHNKIIGL